MTLAQLFDARQAALAHLNVCRRLRDAVQADISAANQHREQVAQATLDLFDHLADAEKIASKRYNAACQAVETQLCINAGINPEPQP